jgi:hypothetical protein
VLYLLLVLMLTGLAYVAWRVVRASANRPAIRVIGPDDDPEFLRRIGHDDADPR